MKVCENCEIEISTKDGENVCSECEKKELQKMRRNARAKANRAAMRAAMDSVGLVRVRGAMGGIYYE